MKLKAQLAATLILVFVAGQALAQEAPKAVAEGGWLSALLGLCCVGGTGLVCIGGVVGGIVWLMRKSAPAAPVDVSAPARFEGGGLRFEHPRAWSAKEGQGLVGPQMALSGEPLTFFIIQRMPGADLYLTSFQASFHEEMAKKTPEERAVAEKNLKDAGGLDQLARNSRQAHMVGLAQGLIESTLQSRGLPAPTFHEATEAGQLAGQPARRFTFTAGAGTGEATVTALGSQFLFVVWMTSTPNVASGRPGAEVVLKSLVVTDPEAAKAAN